MPHFRSKQTLIRDIKLSAAHKLFMHPSWSLFVLQLGAKQGTPKCRLCTQSKSLINKVRLSPFFIKKKKEEKEEGGGNLFRLEILKGWGFFLLLFVFWGFLFVLGFCFVFVLLLFLI